MKKFFHYLAAALLVGTSFAAASCSDDEPTPPTPQFPTPLAQQTILPGESSSFQIKPNMEWEVSIPEDARKWFYLDDNGQKVSKLRGAAVVGDKAITITVGTEKGEPFDEKPTVDVTMTMGNPAESQKIATFVIKQMARELKFYPALIEEGEYVFNEEAEFPQYRYENEPKTEGSVKLEKHGAFYGARLLVESNVSWTLSVPDWVDVRVNGEVATAGKAGQSEVELRANTASNKFLLEGATNVACPFKATKSDDSSVELAKIAVSMDDLTGLLECEGLPAEALFSPRGSYLPNASTLGASLNGSITAPNGAQIIAIAKGMYGGYDEWQGQPWVKAEIDPWSGDDKIQSRDVTISVEPRGHGGLNNQERQAVLFVLPATLKDKTMTMNDLLTDDWSDVREDYKQYLVTTITQEASTGYLSAMNSKAMEAGKATLEYDQWGMFDETLAQYSTWMASHEDYGFFYRLTYGDPYSSDGATLEINDNVPWAPEGGYASYKIFGYNAGSAGEPLPVDQKWITLQENRNAETNVVESINVQMNFDEEYTSYYGDGKKYAVIVFFDDQNRPFITLECTYDDGTGSGGGETGALSLSEYASYEGSTLELLQAGDADYDKYAATYADFTPSVYRVTFTTLAPTMSGIKGLPEYGSWCEVIDGDWLSRPEPGEEVTFAGLMNSDKSAKGAYIFYSGGTGFDEATQKVVDPQGPAVILVVNLVLGE